MDERVFICGASALDVLRRLRAAGSYDILRPTRIRSITGCAHTKASVSETLNRIDPSIRSLLPAGLATKTNPIHIAVPNQASKTRPSGIVAHVQSEGFPPGTYCQLDDNVFVLSPEACFAWCASKLSTPRCIVISMELTGTYTFSPEDSGYGFDAVKVTTLDKLADYCSRLPHSHATALQKAISALCWAAEDSASPMETVLVVLLVLPYRHGGYGIEVPKMNVPLDRCGNVVPLMTPGSRRPDVIWPDHKLVLEYNGREAHHGSDDYERDSDRRDEFERNGYRVIPVSAGKLYDAERFHEMAVEIASITGKRLQLPRGFADKRDRLRAEILPHRRRPSGRRTMSSRVGQP